jgi:transcription initiation factor TFIID subunit 13
MSYAHYPQPGAPPTSTTYPYGTYPPQRLGAYVHPPIPGAYPYQPAAYQTGVTSYGWPYPYSYVPHLPQPVHPQRPGAQTPAPVTAHIPSPAVQPTTAPPRPSTFTSYTRESAASGVTGRGSRKQSTVKGLFTKEREIEIDVLCYDATNLPFPVKSLMYGFGDDRNPATDSVNVMEEILVEYITDVVRCISRLFSS